MLLSLLYFGNDSRFFNIVLTMGQERVYFIKVL